MRISRQRFLLLAWFFMEPPPSRYQHLHLPRGEVVVYATVRPNIRVLARDIRALGYDVWDHHVDITGFRHPQPPPGVLLQSIILGRVILLFAEREEGSSTRDSSSSGSSDQSSEGSSETYLDSSNVDSDTGQWGRRSRRHNPDAERANTGN